jgi:hypothetical protein
MVNSKSMSSRCCSSMRSQGGAAMIDFDADCADAAAAVLKRGQDDELIAAHLRETLPSMQAVATAVSRVAGEQPRRKPRRNRSIRLRRDDEGVLVAEDITPAPGPSIEEASKPADADVGEAPAIEIDGGQAPHPEPTPGGFADIFGSLEGT